MLIILVVYDSVATIFWAIFEQTTYVRIDIGISSTNDYLHDVTYNKTVPKGTVLLCLLSDKVIIHTGITPSCIIKDKHCGFVIWLYSTDWSEVTQTAVVCLKS